METYLVAYLLAVNALAFLTFGLDKWRAGRGSRRVPEARLLLLALALGAPGAWLAMRAFRHKTVKRSFRLRFALAGLVNLAAFAGIGWWYWRRELG